jgi:hypothetical protein
MGDKDEGDKDDIAFLVNHEKVGARYGVENFNDYQT